MFTLWGPGDFLLLTLLLIINGSSQAKELKDKYSSNLFPRAVIWTEESKSHTLWLDAELWVTWRMTHISGAVNDRHLPGYIVHYTHESLEKKMHTCTLCTSSIACESFWSASRIKSVSLWMMTSSWPCSSRGWLRSSCGDQDIGVLKATADAQEYNYSQRFTSHYELNYYSLKKQNTLPLLVALFIALTLVLTKFMLYLFEMTTPGYIYHVLQHQS